MRQGMNGSERDSVVIRLRREIHSTLQTGLRSAGFGELQQILGEMKKRTKEQHSFVPERTLRRYLHEWGLTPGIRGSVPGVPALER
jgi:hypothetical protein